MSKLDILAFGAHPDDVELSCGGTLAKHAALGKKTGIVDFSNGELGTRGTPELRLEEAANAAVILKTEIRENLNFKDGFFKHDDIHLIEIIKRIRLYKPDIVLANAVDDRHPDHGRAAAMVKEAVFLSGLKKITTHYNDVQLEAWRPKKLLFYIQNNFIPPELIIDITDYFDIKVKSILAYQSQFHHKDYQKNEPETYISSPEFLDFLHARAANLGRLIGKKYGEGFTSNTVTGITDFDKIILNNR